MKFWVVLGVFVVFLVIYYNSVINELAGTIKELNTTNEQLNKEINKQGKIIQELIGKVVELNDSLKECNNDLKKINDSKQVILKQKIEYKKKVEELREKLKSNGLRNPTYAELQRFVIFDNTDQKEWSEDFDCTEFSNTLIKNLVKKGYFACTTELDIIENGEVGGHIIVAVNTTDKGLVYVEPQSDQIIEANKLSVGKNYCSVVDWDCYWEITKISSCFYHVTNK